MLLAVAIRLSFTLPASSSPNSEIQPLLQQRCSQDEVSRHKRALPVKSGRYRVKISLVLRRCHHIA